MTSEIRLLKDFVEDNIPAEEFEQQLYTNPSLEGLLADPAMDWSGTYLKNATPFLYLAELNYKTAAGRLHAHATVDLFLRKLGIETMPSKKYAEDYDLLASSTPKYINAEPAFIERNILLVDKTLSKAGKTQIIKQRYAELFRFQSKPPRWIQHPDWPVKNDRPLFFLGQIAIKDCGLFHDDGSVYVFVDAETGAIETVKQFY